MRRIEKSERTRDNPTAKRAIGSSLRRFSFPPQETVGEIKNPGVNYVKLKVSYTIVILSKIWTSFQEGSL